MLEPEQFSSDIKTPVLGLHAQALAWEGLRAIASAWRNAGHPGYAERAEHVAARLAPALRRAVSRSQRRLGDGSLFLPMRLDSGEVPYDTVTESRAGSYWNLVAPYALASGLFQPRSRAGPGRARAICCRTDRGSSGWCAPAASRSTGPARTRRVGHRPGVRREPVAVPGRARMSADQLVLSLYGQLAAGMTPNTFVAGEAASVAPLDGLRYRAMYLPPNASPNDSFLETLRLMLVQDPVAGLRLAFATPRGWLDAGKRIAVTAAPTAFGPVSYSLTASARRGAVVHRDALGCGRPRSCCACGCPPGGASSRVGAPARVRPCDRHDRPLRNGGLDSISWCGPRRVRPRGAGVDVRLRGCGDLVCPAARWARLTSRGRSSSARSGSGRSPTGPTTACAATRTSRCRARTGRGMRRRSRS